MANSDNVALVSYNNYRDFCNNNNLKAINKVEFYEYIIFYFVDSQLNCEDIDHTRKGVIRVNDEVNVYLTFDDKQYFIGFDTKSIEELDEIFERQQQEEQKDEECDDVNEMIAQFE